MSEITTGEHPVEETVPDSPGGIRAEFRPLFSGGHHVLITFATGSVALVGLGWEWLVSEGWRTALERSGYVAAGLYVGATFVGKSPFVMPLAVGAWCVAAFVVPSPAKDKTAKGAVATGEPVEETAVDSPVPDLELVATLIREIAADNGHSGTHLDDIVDTGELGDWDKADLRTALEEWAVPVEEFKLLFGERKRQRVRLGVRLKALPDGLGEGAVDADRETPAGPPAGAAPAAPTGAAKTGPESGG
ncbi:hypothetical protein ACFXKG_40370 [Streptomyces sp. NPDC059255]|uniref:hypothetical protein n=1 Tax=Streptomyces sp. NPDC059255 TaxID=3346793 RepID=UPI003680AAD3